MGAGAVGNNVGGVHVPSERYLITGGGGPRKTQKAIR
jgi:hypothetical protein